jgi:hypothetical protein
MLFFGFGDIHQLVAIIRISAGRTAGAKFAHDKITNTSSAGILLLCRVLSICAFKTRPNTNSGTGHDNAGIWCASNSGIDSSA